MERKEFKELLLLYGADPGAWPAEFKDEALSLLCAESEAASELTALVEEELKFEALLKERSFEEPSDYLAGKIIAFAEESATQESAARETRGLFGYLFAEFFTPRAAVALALALVIGFMAGYMTPEASLDPYDQLISDDSAMLEETFSSLFMEDDIFE